jgi:transposase
MRRNPLLKIALVGTTALFGPKRPPRHRKINGLRKQKSCDGGRIGEVGLGRARRHGWKPRRIGHNLLGRLDLRRADVLRFLHNPDVPFTNNDAERDARMMKLRQKISGGFRAQTSADDFAVIRSVLSTAKKQGWNILSTLRQGPGELTIALKTASGSNLGSHLTDKTNPNFMNEISEGPSYIPNGTVGVPWFRRLR